MKKYMVAMFLPDTGDIENQVWIAENNFHLKQFLDVYQQDGHGQAQSVFLLEEQDIEYFKPPVDSRIEKLTRVLRKHGAHVLQTNLKGLAQEILKEIDNG